MNLPTSSRSESESIGSRVLLVDDDPVLVHALGETLARRLQSTAIDTCTSGNAALGRIATTEYDVVISDFLMPGVHGLELFERLREIKPGTLTILITGADDRELALRALRGGTYDFILKPVDPDYFAASVLRAIETRRLQREVERQQEELLRHAEELERTVEERTRELREAHRLKDEFLATVSHELRTPLTAILGWARLLCGTTLDAATKQQAIEAIARNARSQAQLIDDLLDVARIITGKLRLDIEEVDVYAVLDAALGSVLPAAQAKSIRIEPVWEPDIGTITADPERLQQVFWNLLSNAIKFTPERGRVEVRVARAGSDIEVVISDDGCGIREEFLPLVFDRLRQGDASQRGSRRGLGLGLAIVRHLVELHGGVVKADSGGEGKGSTFSVRLPAERSDAHRERKRGSRATLRSRDVATPPRCLAGARVLVVDDDEDTRDVIAFELRRAGAEVEVAGSAEEGFAAFEREPPDVFLCDIGLPDQDGHALLRRVRALPTGGRAIPAVALTAYAKSEDRTSALSAGFHLHVPKPGPPDLAALLAGLLAGETRSPEAQQLGTHGDFLPKSS